MLYTGLVFFKLQMGSALWPNEYNDVELKIKHKLLKIYTQQPPVPSLVGHTLQLYSCQTWSRVQSGPEPDW